MAITSTPKKDEFMRICDYIVTPSIGTETTSEPYRIPSDRTEIQICGKVIDIAKVESLLGRMDSVGEESVVIDSINYRPGKVKPEERLRVKLKKWNRWLAEYYELSGTKAGELDA